MFLCNETVIKTDHFIHYKNNNGHLAMRLETMKTGETEVMCSSLTVTKVG